jgi:hypothetical protein
MEREGVVQCPQHDGSTVRSRRQYTRGGSVCEQVRRTGRTQQYKPSDSSRLCVCHIVIAARGTKPWSTLSTTVLGCLWRGASRACFRVKTVPTIYQGVNAETVRTSGMFWLNVG